MFMPQHVLLHLSFTDYHPSCSSSCCCCCASTYLITLLARSAFDWCRCNKTFHPQWPLISIHSPFSLFSLKLISLFKCDSCAIQSFSLIVPSCPSLSLYLKLHPELLIPFLILIQFSVFESLLGVKAIINHIAHAHYKTLFYYYRIRRKQTTRIWRRSRSRNRRRGRQRWWRINFGAQSKQKLRNCLAIGFHFDWSAIYYASNYRVNVASSAKFNELLRTNSLFTASLIMVHMFAIVIVIVSLCLVIVILLC